MKRAAALALAALMLLMAGCAIESPRAKVSRSSVKPSQRSAPTVGEVYVVTKGDTLYSIAFRNNLDYRQLAEWNGIGSDYRINIGQRLRLTPPGAAATGDVATQAPQRVAPTQSAQPVLPMLEGAGTWEWPTRGSVARGFDAGGNKGLDIAGELGQIVVASRGGRVVYSGAALKGYGELVIIKHDEQYLSAYGYNRKRLVNEGEEVGPGQSIAELGEGPAQKPLLHFEIRDRGRPLDPRRLLPAR